MAGGGVGSALPTELLPVLVLHAGGISWNKRCGLAYLHERLHRVKAAWWETTGVLTSPKALELRECMAPHELRFFDAYNALIGEYMDSSGVEVSQGVAPPRSVWVEVLVLRTVEPILGTDGNPIQLIAGMKKRMKSVDADHLLRQHLVQLQE